MDNLVYVLVGIAWVAYSLYSARQKAIKKQQSAGMPPTGPSQSSPLPIPGNQGGGKSLFEDIFRELTGEPMPVPPAPQPAMQVNPVKPKNVSVLDVPYEGFSGYKFGSGIPADYARNESKNDIITHADNEQLTKNEVFSKNFNLREAVIFSELLNRKYF